jgi:hypothetical protein
MDNKHNSPDQRWKMQKAKLQLKFPHLNEDDFKYDYGMKDTMMDNLQAKLGKTRDELNELLINL